MAGLWTEEDMEAVVRERAGRLPEQYVVRLLSIGGWAVYDTNTGVSVQVFKSDREAQRNADVRNGRADRHGNEVAREGYDRCSCGCKYWECDRCVDCGARVTDLSVERPML